MKILYFNHNQDTNMCTLEVEIEGEKIAIRFHGERDYHYNVNFQPVAILSPTLSNYNNQKLTKINNKYGIEDNNDYINIQRSKIELSNYLSEKLFREYDAIKKLKQ